MTPRMQYLRAGLVALLVAGCTTFTARQVNLQHEPNARGLLVPDQVPLLVIANGQVSTVMVRSPDRATAIEFGAFLAKHDVQIDFLDTGGLKTVKSNQDSTAVPLKLLDIAGALAQHVLPEGQGLSGTNTSATSLQIYKIIFQGGEIVSLEPLLDSSNFPPLRLQYELVPVTGETPIGELPKKANPPAKGG